MVNEKLKIVCSVKAARLEFVSLPIGNQLQPNFYKLSWVEKKITKLIFSVFLMHFICIINIGY